jgi:UDP-GlcNAc:undecaprenyl-phosphate GlcNAc-1-phosphate transferase
MLACLSSFLITVLMMVLLRRLAPRLGLMDRPGGHKTHHGAVPVVGGVSMFVGFAAGLWALPQVDSEVGAFLAAAGLLVFVGSGDDRTPLTPRLRLCVHVAAAAVMVFVAGLHIDVVARLSGGEAIRLGMFAPLFTVFAVAAAINAFNLIDGLDGLAGGLGLITILFLVIFSSGPPGDVAVLLALAAAIAGFLPFNIPVLFNRSIRCFMGDAGSTLLGFTVAWYGTKLTQSPQTKFSPVMMLWITALPVQDLLTSILRRIANGKSPFVADADHFHHRLIRAGFSVRATFSTLFGLALTFGVIGTSLHAVGYSDFASFTLFTAFAGVTSTALLNADLLAKYVPEAFLRQGLPAGTVNVSANRVSPLT